MQALEGSISIAFNKDPSSAAVLRDQGYLLFKTSLRRFEPSVTSKELRHARHVRRIHDGRRAQARRQEPDPPERDERRHAPERAGNAFLVRGIVVHTNPRASFPISQAKLQRWHDGRCVQFGKLVR